MIFLLLARVVLGPLIHLNQVTYNFTHFPLTDTNKYWHISIIPMRIILSRPTDNLMIEMLNFDIALI